MDHIQQGASSTIDTQCCGGPSNAAFRGCCRKTAFCRVFPACCCRGTAARADYQQCSVCEDGVGDIDVPQQSAASFIGNNTVPARLIASTFRILVAMLLLTYLLQDPEEHVDEKATSTLFIITRGFRELPYAFLFAAMWILITMMIAAAVYLTLVQHKLEHHETQTGMYKAKQVIGILWVVFMIGDLFIIIPDWTLSAVTAIPTILLIAAWIVVAYTRPETNPYRPAIWAVIFCVLSFLSAVDDIGVYATVLLCVFLGFVQYVDPDAPALVITTVIRKSNREVTTEEL